MDTTQIVVAVIGLFGVIISVFATAKATQNKVTQELQTQNEVQNQKIDQLSVDINTTKTELTTKIDSNQILTETKISFLTSEMTEMKTDIREHNNYAKSMPVIEEKVKVINNRLNDLEAFQKQFYDK